MHETLATDLQPKMHGAISDLETFIETFLFFFEQGSNAEFVSPDRDLFYLLHNRLFDGKSAASPLPDNSIAVAEEIGGHSSVFAIRAQFEQCRVYTTPNPSDFNIENLERKDLNEGSDLILPIEHIMEGVDQREIGRRQDIHLVFEYEQGDEILGVVAPRSNRFYFVHDPNGATITQLETYHDILDKVHENDKPYRHLFGGYQLMQNLELEVAEQRLKKMA